MSFISEVKAELTKIVWPTRDELFGATIIVCILVLVFAVILGTMDFGFSYLIKRVII